MGRVPTGIFCRVLRAGLWWSGGLVAGAQTTNLPPLGAPLPDTAASLLRLFGALVLVMALFLGGVWAFQRWQKLAMTHGRPPKMHLLEARSLGHRHTLYIVGYEQERLLLAASPNGISLVSHLPQAEPGESEPPRASFTDALRQVLSRKT